VSTRRCTGSTDVYTVNEALYRFDERYTCNERRTGSTGRYTMQRGVVQVQRDVYTVQRGVVQVQRTFTRATRRRTGSTRRLHCNETLTGSTRRLHSAWTLYRFDETFTRCNETLYRFDEMFNGQRDVVQVDAEERSITAVMRAWFLFNPSRRPAPVPESRSGSNAPARSRLRHG